MTTNGKEALMNMLWYEIQNAENKLYDLKAQYAELSWLPDDDEPPAPTLTAEQPQRKEDDIDMEFAHYMMTWGVNWALALAGGSANPNETSIEQVRKAIEAWKAHQEAQ